MTSASAPHNCTVLSELADTCVRPFGVKATALTHDLWPAKSPFTPPVGTPHRRTVPSMLPVATKSPSGRKATVITAPLWPVRVRISRRVVTSHSFAVWS
jgi:hypothetical protein